MSDNIPFEIQMEIIKKVSAVKSLIKFRSVSKPWKSFIESSEFIKGYGVRHTLPHSFILSYQVKYSSQPKFICLVDDDNNENSIKVQQQEFAPFVMSPFLKLFDVYNVVGVSHGLLCFYGFHYRYNNWMVVIWNPCIGKSVGIVVPKYDNLTCNYGFGVHPVTSDPTVVKLVCADNMPWHVEVFTLSSGVWNVIPSDKLPRQSIELDKSTQVVIDRFIYWGAWEKTFMDNGESTINQMVVSFDLITKEFKVVDLGKSFTILWFCISKLRGSLVVSGYTQVEGALCCGVWVMEHDSSFRKLFSVAAPYFKILAFTKNSEPIYEIEKEDRRCTTLNVYDPCSQQIKNLGISGVGDSFYMGSYKESLLLLNHPDLHIYSDDS